MADTRVQLEVEDWVRREWMKKHFAMRFSRERVRLSCGGYFDADAVSEDFKVVAAISTSGARTSGGKNAVGKMLKIRSDMYFLLLADAERRLMVLTEADMFAQCRKEAVGGRVPKTIEFFHADIPAELKERLVASRGIASGEIIVNGKLPA
jgi:hypothetical protein